MVLHEAKLLQNETELVVLLGLPGCESYGCSISDAAYSVVAVAAVDWPHSMELAHLKPEQTVKPEALVE